LGEAGEAPSRQRGGSRKLSTVAAGHSCGSRNGMKIEYNLGFYAVLI